MPSLSRSLLLALVWLALTSSMTVASNVKPKQYRVRGVVKRTRLEQRALQKSEKEAQKKFEDRTYSSKFVDGGMESASGEEDDSGSGRSDDACGSARSGKESKAKSGDSAARSADKLSKGDSAARSAEKTSKAGKSGASGRAECSGRSGKNKSKKGSEKKGSFGEREYPEENIMAATSAEKSGSKKGKKGTGASVLSASAEGCARDGTGGSSASKKGSKGRRTRGLKSKKGSSGDTGRSAEDECAESVSGSGKSVKSGSKFAKAKSGGVKATGASAVEPAREYPVISNAAADKGQVADPKQGGSVTVSGGIAPPPQQETPATVSLASVAAVTCNAIADGQAPLDGDYRVQNYDITADVNIDTSQTSTADFLSNFRSYLQREVALDIAGCDSPSALEEVPADSKIRDVVFDQPFDTGGECAASSTSSLSSESGEAFDFSEEQQIGKKTFLSGYKRQGEVDLGAKDEEYPTTIALEDESTAALGTPSSLASSEDCYNVLVPVSIYLSENADEGDIEDARSSLELAMSQANMNDLQGIEIGSVADTGSYTSAGVRASLNSDGSNGNNKKIAFSMGILGVILVSLAAMKVAFNRKRRAQAGKDLYADMEDDDYDPDDTTFIYPSEDELLGPEFGDEEFEVAYNNHHKNGYGRNDAKGSAYILEDLQDGMSVDTGSSYASSKRPIPFRTVPATPDHRKGCC